jgi:branched-chain amino acid transport system ATP-binding protein
VEQNLDTILAVSERCYVMEKGRIVAGIAPGQVTAETVRAHLSI